MSPLRNNKIHKLIDLRKSYYSHFLLVALSTWQGAGGSATFRGVLIISITEYGAKTIPVERSEKTINFTTELIEL